MPWAGPGLAQRLLVDYIRLRQRLEPYAASLDGAPLAPWATDKDLAPPPELADYRASATRLRAFAFGPALRIHPLPAADAADQRLFLPAGSRWFDFWTGVAYPGGDSIRIPTFLEILPIFVPAGSILPLASDAAPCEDAPRAMELRVYRGADGVFHLQIPATGPRAKGKPVPLRIAWDDASHVLRIERHGRGAPRRLQPISFDIVLVAPGRGAGQLRPSRPDARITYEGADLSLQFPPAPPPPQTPSGLSARVSERRIHFVWHQTAPNLIYRLKRRNISELAYEDLASALTEPRHAIPEPDEPEQWEYVVTAINPGGESPPSETVRPSPAVETIAETPPAPAAETTNPPAKRTRRAKTPKPFSLRNRPANIGETAPPPSIR